MATYEIDNQGWKLIVSDNGIGKNAAANAVAVTSDLGTAIIKALVRSAMREWNVACNASGTKVSITRTTFTVRMPHEQS